MKRASRAPGPASLPVLRPQGVPEPHLYGREHPKALDALAALAPKPKPPTADSVAGNWFSDPALALSRARKAFVEALKAPAEPPEAAPDADAAGRYRRAQEEAIAAVVRTTQELGDEEAGRTHAETAKDLLLAHCFRGGRDLWESAHPRGGPLPEAYGLAGFPYGSPASAREAGCSGAVVSAEAMARILRVTRLCDHAINPQQGTITLRKSVTSSRTERAPLYCEFACSLQTDYGVPWRMAFPYYVVAQALPYRNAEEVIALLKGTPEGAAEMAEWFRRMDSILYADGGSEVTREAHEAAERLGGSMEPWRAGALWEMQLLFSCASVDLPDDAVVVQLGGFDALGGSSVPHQHPPAHHPEPLPDDSESEEEEEGDEEEEEEEEEDSDEGESTGTLVPLAGPQGQIGAELPETLPTAWPCKHRRRRGKSLYTKSMGHEYATEFARDAGLASLRPRSVARLAIIALLCRTDAERRAALALCFAHAGALAARLKAAERSALCSGPPADEADLERLLALYDDLEGEAEEGSLGEVDAFNAILDACLPIERRATLASDKIKRYVTARVLGHGRRWKGAEEAVARFLREHPSPPAETVAILAEMAPEEQEDAPIND